MLRAIYRKQRCWLILHDSNCDINDRSLIMSDNLEIISLVWETNVIDT